MSRRPDEAEALRPPTPPGRRDWEAIRTVVRKDLTAVRRSKAIVLPMILVPLVLLVAMPVSLGLFARSADSSQVSRVLSSPVVSSVTVDIVALPEREQLVVLVLGYLLSPLLLVIPLMVSAVLAADAFAGEKERRTLESMLHLPISDGDLYLAKILGAYLPAVTITWVSAVIYAVVTNLVGWPAMGRLFIPFQQWTAMIVWVAPAVALLSLGLLVFVSSKARTTQEANQLGGAVILPLIFVAASQATALLLVPLLGVVLAGLVLWGVALALVAAGSSRFTRDRLATSA
ncbi:MAG: ABC transporter permease subunit [Acidimicrobiales bacterium]|nr:ABC transporter permease subunit [Acidimicrobiales bacterium]